MLSKPYIIDSSGSRVAISHPIFCLHGQLKQSPIDIKQILQQTIHTIRLFLSILLYIKLPLLKTFKTIYNIISIIISKITDLIYIHLIQNLQYH